MFFAPVVVSQHQSSAGPVVKQVRGSVLVSSLQTLRMLHHYDQYIKLLPVTMHEQVLYALAASWVPTEVALAHYAACEALELSEQELSAMGTHVGERTMGTFLGTLVRVTGMGRAVQPIRALDHFPRLWDRLLQGGACTVTRKGPKDAVVDSQGVPMFRYRYYSTAYVALLRSLGGLIGKDVHARITRRSDSSLSVLLSWV